VKILPELQFLWKKPPYCLLLYVTSRCNLTCKHCFNYQNFLSAGLRNELSLEEIQRFSSGLGYLKALSVTGGEPFIRKDIFEIIELFYKNNATRYFAIHTNGICQKEILYFIERHCRIHNDTYLQLCLSIDEIGDSFDKIRERPGAWKILTDTFKKIVLLQKSYKNIFIFCNTTVMHSNETRLAEIHNYIVNTIKARHALSLIRGNPKEPEEKKIDYKNVLNFINNIYLDRPAISPFTPVIIKEIMESLVTEITLRAMREKRQIIPCKAARNLVTIMDNGDVISCEIRNDLLGNLRNYNYDLRALLNNQKTKEVLKSIQNNECYCTWENPITTSIIFNPQYYFKIFFTWLKYLQTGVITRKVA